VTANERFDVVYTWVDGAFPGYPELLQRFADKTLDLNPNRFRDNLEMLKYSIRSVERHAPWMNRLYIVTTRPQVPEWLDRDAPGVTVIHHDEIFDPEYLPSFNSLAIVSNLHRIPGLSRRFVYFEDDVLLGRPVTVRDLFDEEGRIRIFERYTFEDNAWRHGSDKLSLWASVLARSNRLLNDRYGWRWHGSLHDAPIVMDKVLFGEMVESWKDEIARTRASRFRTFGNISLEHMFHYYLHYEGHAVFVPKWEVYRDTSYLGLGNSSPLTWLGLNRLRLRRPKFYCLNDNFGDHPNPRSVHLVKAYLEEKYPDPSRFERV